jgi:hypothetical protein
MGLARSQIRSTAKTALEAATGLSGILVVIDSGGQAEREAMEAAIRTDGVVISIPPLSGSTQRDQAGRRLLEWVALDIYLRTNPASEADASAAEARIDAIIKAILSDATLEAKAGPEEVTRWLGADDPGLLSHAVMFACPITPPAG